MSIFVSRPCSVPAVVLVRIPFSMCCSVLQRVAACYRLSQCVAVRCRVLPCVAVCCSALQRVAVCCSVSSPGLFCTSRPVVVVRLTTYKYMCIKNIYIYICCVYKYIHMHLHIYTFTHVHMCVYLSWDAPLYTHIYETCVYTYICIFYVSLRHCLLLTVTGSIRHCSWLTGSFLEVSFHIYVRGGFG